MFILKTNIKDYYEKEHKKEIARIKCAHKKMIKKIQYEHELELKQVERENERMINGKNRKIKKLIFQRELYIDKSLEYNFNIERIEKLRKTIINVLGSLVHDCDEILHSDLMNSIFVYKNENRLRRVK